DRLARARHEPTRAMVAPETGREEIGWAGRSGAQAPGGASSVTVLREECDVGRAHRVAANDRRSGNEESASSERRAASGDHRRSQDHTSSAQMAEYPGPADQVAPCQPPRIAQEPVQPFERHLLHPARRPSLHPGEEVQGGADTEDEPLRRPAARELQCHLFLLWRSYREEAEAERTR